MPSHVRPLIASLIATLRGERTHIADVHLIKLAPADSPVEIPAPFLSHDGHTHDGTRI